MRRIESGLRRRAERICAGIGIALGAIGALTGDPGAAGAEEWQVIGARYQGLGGAGVALALDSDAASWNPGALALVGRTEELSLRGGLAGASEGDFLDHVAGAVDYVDRTGLESPIRRLRSGGGLSEQELQRVIPLVVSHAPALVPNDQGAQAWADTGLVMRRGRLALSGRSFAFAGVDPRLTLGSFSLGAAGIDAAQLVGAGADRSADFQNGASASLAQALADANASLSAAQAQELVFQAEQAGIDTSNGAARSRLLRLAQGLGAGGAGERSGVAVRGLFVKELSLSYGFPLIEGVLGIGGNLKFLHGATHSEYVGVDASGDTTRSSGSPRRRSREWGLDLGLIYQPAPWVRLGLSGRNLNTPSFKTVSGQESIRLEPQLRGGVAFDIGPRWRVAVDLDLTENGFETLGGVRSRLLAAGFEYRTRLREMTVDLRAGAYQNLASGSDDPLTLTFGMGMHLRSQSRLDLSFSYGLGAERAPRLDGRVPRRVEFAGAVRWIREY